jgi:hypothetical protein
VIENFSLYGMQKFGLEYDVLREVNPHLIMLSMQAMGRSGPHKEYVTFGPNLLSLTGLDRPTRVRHLFKPPAQPRVPRSPSECVDPATLGRRGNAPSTNPRRPCGCRATHRRSHGTRSPPAGQRQAQRAGEAWSASEGRWAVYLQQKAAYEAPSELSSTERVTVDTSKPLGDQLALIP